MRAGKDLDLGFIRIDDRNGRFHTYSEEVANRLESTNNVRGQRAVCEHVTDESVGLADDRLVTRVTRARRL